MFYLLLNYIHFASHVRHRSKTSARETKLTKPTNKNLTLCYVSPVVNTDTYIIVAAVTALALVVSLQGKRTANAFFQRLIEASIISSRTPPTWPSSQPQSHHNRSSHPTTIHAHPRPRRSYPRVMCVAKTRANRGW